jgi:hypothetical protein
LDDVALADYVIGINYGHVEAGRIDGECARLLNVLAGTPIWLSDYTLLKLAHVHGEITYQHFRYMPQILVHGFRAQGRKPHVLEAWWIDERDADPAGMFAVLKATKRGEVFVDTFHPVHRKEARRLARKAGRENRLIRSQRGYEDIRNI